jgi:hypothetical protein
MIFDYYFLKYAVISVLSDGSINNFEELFLGRLAENLTFLTTMCI